MTASEPMPELGLEDRHDRSFLGHPKGLGYLAFTEAWERFSFYGMQALLVLYMAKELLLPGHVENVALIEPFRSPHARGRTRWRLSPRGRAFLAIESASAPPSQEANPG